MAKKPMRIAHPSQPQHVQARAAMLSIGKVMGLLWPTLNAINSSANAEYYDANGRRTNIPQKV